jgi:hypothetical protein
LRQLNGSTGLAVHLAFHACRSVERIVVGSCVYPPPHSHTLSDGNGSCGRCLVESGSCRSFSFDASRLWPDSRLSWGGQSSCYCETRKFLSSLPIDNEKRHETQWIIIRYSYRILENKSFATSASVLELSISLLQRIVALSSPSRAPPTHRPCHLERCKAGEDRSPRPPTYILSDCPWLFLLASPS